MVESSNKFDYKDLLKNLLELKASLPVVDSIPFYQTMLEFVKIFDFMGSGLQMAFKGFFFSNQHLLILFLDITSKVALIKRNYEHTPEIKGGIMDFIKYEGDMKIQRLNGENPKEAPDPKYARYESSILF